jgi:hypothetical protein
MVGGKKSSPANSDRALEATVWHGNDTGRRRRRRTHVGLINGRRRDENEERLGSADCGSYEGSAASCKQTRAKERKTERGSSLPRREA